MTRNLALAAITCVLALGCSPRERQAATSAPTRPVADPVTSLLTEVTQACTGSVVSPPCRGRLAALAACRDPRALPLLRQWLQPLCAGGVDAACTGAAATLARAADLEIVRALAAVEQLPAEQGLRLVAPEALRDASAQLCDVVPPEAGCARVLDALGPGGGAEVEGRRSALALWSAVAAAAATPRGQRAAALRRRLPDGAAAVPALLALMQRPGCRGEPEAAVIEYILALGEAARPYLVEAVKYQALPVSLRAAALGWDPATSELENPATAEGRERTVHLDEAADYVGREVRVQLRGGGERRGTLVKVDDTTLHFESRIGGGTIAFQVKRDEVERIQF